MNVLLVLVAVFVLDVSATTQDRYSRDNGATYRSSGQDSSSSGYGGYNSGRGFNQGFRFPPPPPPPPPPSDSAPFTDLDALYERADDALAQLRFASEQLGVLESRLGVQKKDFDNLVLIVFEELDNLDERQNLALDALEDMIKELEDQVFNELKPSIDDLIKTNKDNLAAYNENLGILQTEMSLDIRQDGEFSELLVLATDFKSKLLQVAENYFALFRDQVARAEGAEQAVEIKETRRICESGKVTLYNDDRRKTVQFVNDYGVTPQLIFGVDAFDINTGASDSTPAPTNGYGYGYVPPPPPEPNAIGFKINGYATDKGATFEGLDLGYGGTEALSVQLSYQVCAIGPGTGPLKY